MAAHQRLFSEIHSMQLFMRKLLTILCLIPLVTLSASAQCLQLLFATVDINIGETRHVELPDGSDATVKLIAKDIDREVAGAIHAAHVEVRMNDQTVTLGCGTYNLPVTAGGVQIDCGVVDDYIVDATSNYWALDKDARLRVWPEDSPWIRPDTFGYPLDQRIFASATHFSNEPAGYRPGERFYYPAALDFGGAESMDTVFATTDGLVVSARNELMDAHRNQVATELGAGRGSPHTSLKTLC